MSKNAGVHWFCGWCSGVRSTVAVLLLLSTVGCAASISPLVSRLAAAPEDPLVNLELGEEAARDGDLLRAEQYFIRAQALGAQPARVTPALMRVLVRAHRYSEALVRCDDRLKVHPEERPTRYLRAVLLRALDRLPEAEQELNSLSLDGSDPDVHFELAGVYAQDGEKARARREWREYLRLAPRGAHSGAAQRLLRDEEPSGLAAEGRSFDGP